VLPTQKDVGDVYVDFTGQSSYKAVPEKTSRDHIMRETNETADGTPENLLDKKTSNLVLNYLYIW
jgi:hypothetical protein